MKLKKFTFWPYVLVASLLSYLLFLISGGYFSEDKEAIIGVSGFLIAGSWSFLSIETNKEIRRRDEVIRYLNEYEEAVLNLVHGTTRFYQVFSKLKIFILSSDLSTENVENKISKGEKALSDIEKHNSNYSSERKGLLYDDLVSQQNTLIYLDNIVRIRGGLLQLCISSKNEIDKIEAKCDSLILNIRKTASKDNILSKKPVFSVDSKELVSMQETLFLVLSEKMKNFEERSEDYAEKQNLCIFLIIFGFFFSFWNFTNFLF